MKTRFLTLTMLLAAMGLAFVACKKEDPKPKGEPVGKVISATLGSPDGMRSPDGRTHLDVTTGGLTPTLWSEWDQVLLFSPNGEDSENNPGYLYPFYYNITAGVNTQDAIFEADEYQDPVPEGNAYCVFYPPFDYGDDEYTYEYMFQDFISTSFRQCSCENPEAVDPTFKMEYTMSQIQWYQSIDEGHPNATFAEFASPAIGYGYGTNYRFWNLMGLLRVELFSSTPGNIGLVTLTDKNPDNILWGKAEVDVTGPINTTDVADNMLQSEFENEGGSVCPLPLGIDCIDNGDPNTIALVCLNRDEGNNPTGFISLSTDPNNPTKLYFLVPAYALDDGFEINVYDLSIDYNTFSIQPTLLKTIDKHYSGDIIQRNIITVLPASQTGNLGEPVATIKGCSTNSAYGMTAQVCGFSKTNTTYEVGICYSETNATPTTSDDCYQIITGETINNDEVRSFTGDLTDLVTGTTYYVRAYATNGSETKYGEVKTIKFGDAPVALASNWIGGVSPYPFSVSFPAKSYDYPEKVLFSQGNLRYNAYGADDTDVPHATYTTSYPHVSGEAGSVGGTWRFADHQYDMVGESNTHIASDYYGWIDLFGWGTSGYNHNATCYQPWSTSMNFEDYNAFGLSGGALHDYDGKADWGYNAIVNGGDTEDSWFTLSDGEWSHLLGINGGRDDAENLYGYGVVGCVKGMIILPDYEYWVLPTRLTFTPGPSNWVNEYSYSEWALMEANGAVFLPTAGQRHGTTVTDVKEAGYYWTSFRTSKKKGQCSVWSLVMYSPYGPYTVEAANHDYGYSVRLVKSYHP